MIINILIFIPLLHPIGKHNAMEIPGKYTIGMLLSIHESPNDDHVSSQCAKKIDVDGIEALEAALYALDIINQDIKILPGIPLGIRVLDICWSETLALSHILHLVEGSEVAGYLVPNMMNEDVYTGDLIPTQNTMSASLIGIIGSSRAEQTIKIQKFIQSFGLPQIGYADTMPELDDENQYSTYMRLIPSDAGQSRVIRDILKEYDWTYVSIIRTNGISAEGFSKSFRDLVEPMCDGCGICIAKEFVIDSHHVEESIDGSLRELAADELVNVLISFCEGDMIREVFQGIKRLNLSERFTFIVSDNWKDLPLALTDLMNEAWGTLSVHTVSGQMSGFREYFQSLKPSQNKRNVWFAEYWENIFNCTLQKEISRHPKRCTDELSLATKYRGNRKTNYMIRAVFAFAHGLHKLMKNHCGHDYDGVCSEGSSVDAPSFLAYLSDLTFNDGNELVTMNEIKSKTRYIIKNLQKVSNDAFKFTSIGNWENGSLEMQNEFQSRINKPIISRCALPCQLGYRKEFGKDNKNPGCCWKCKPCGRYKYVSSNQEQCIECSSTEWANRNSTGCEKIPISGRYWFKPMTILTVFLTVTGLIVTLFTLYIFIKYKDTPVVRVSNRELCYVILFSMVIAHISVFLIFLQQTMLTCSLARIIPALALTMMFAGLLTKTVQIARIPLRDEGKRSKTKYQFATTSTQLTIILLCVAIETAICFGIMLIDPPALHRVHRSRDRILLVCSAAPWVLIAPSVFILSLHALCIWYAIKARDVPRNFNEAKFLGFSLLFSVIIWIVFFMLYFGTKEKTIVLNICITLHSSVTLIFLFFPKLYIIIFKPEKNNRALYLQTQSKRTHIGQKVDSTVVNTLSGHTTSRERSFAMPGDSAKLWKTVAIQTDLKFGPDTAYSDDEDSSSDGDANSFHDCGYTSSE